VKISVQSMITLTEWKSSVMLACMYFMIQSFDGQMFIDPKTIYSRFIHANKIQLDVATTVHGAWRVLETVCPSVTADSELAVTHLTFAVCCGS